MKRKRLQERQTGDRSRPADKGRGVRKPAVGPQARGAVPGDPLRLMTREHSRSGRANGLISTATAARTLL